MFQPSPTKFMKSTRSLAGTKAKLIRFATGQSFQHTIMVPTMLDFNMLVALFPAATPPEPDVSAVANANRNMKLSVRFDSARFVFDGEGMGGGHATRNGQGEGGGAGPGDCADCASKRVPNH